MSTHQASERFYPLTQGLFSHEEFVKSGHKLTSSVLAIYLCSESAASFSCHVCKVLPSSRKSYIISTKFPYAERALYETTLNFMLPFLFNHRLM